MSLREFATGFNLNFSRVLIQYYLTLVAICVLYHIRTLDQPYSSYLVEATYTSTTLVEGSRTEFRLQHEYRVMFSTSKVFDEIDS